MLRFVPMVSSFCKARLFDWFFIDFYWRFYCFIFIFSLQFFIYC